MRKPIQVISCKIFFLILCFIPFLSCETDKKDEKISSSNPRILYDKNSSDPWVSYIFDPENDLNIRNKDHIQKTLNYAKIPFGEIEINEFNREPGIPASAKVIVIYDLSTLTKPAMEFLLSFVSKGGHIFIPTVGANKNYGFLAGVKGDATYAIDTVAGGYKFKTNFLPTLKGKIYRNLTKHFGLETGNFREDIEVLASSFSDDNFPLIVRNTVGEGSVIALNTEQFTEKQERGLFFAAILQGLEGVPYPVANASSIMLDDFPAPLYNAKIEPVQSEMDITHASFYTDVWWEDMLKLARKYDIEYSAYVCFDYSNQTSPPFNFGEWEQSVPEGSNSGNAADKLMRDLKHSDHEVALHGYNHSSLTLEEWPNKHFMGLSLQAVRKRWAARDYGSLPTSYVPPSNIIDSTGFVALKENVPNIVYNASIYLGDFEEGGNREYDPEPYNYHFFNFPRITSGYALTPTREFNQQSLYLYTGIWSHFIHPDDIYQIPGEELSGSVGNYALRNSESYGWRRSKDGSPGLLPRFENYIKGVKETFPFIRFLKVSEAARITQNWRQIPYQFKETKNTVVVAAPNEKRGQGENYWFAYVSTANDQKTADFLKENRLEFTKTPFLDGYLFNIKTQDKHLSLPKPEKDHAGQPAAAVVEDYESYLLVQPSGNSGDINKQISKLRSGIAENPEFVLEDWMELFRYLGWESRQNEIWPFLEKKYLKNRSSAYVDLSQDFTSQSDYPDLETRRRWMLRQIDRQPENTALRRIFIEYFGSNAGVELSKEELLELIAGADGADKKFSYLSLLIEKHPETAYDLVETITACSEDFRFAASTIAWIYADAGNYKKAVSWSQCSENIPEEDIDYWRIQTGEIAFLKEKNFPLYIQYLIARNDKHAAQELLEIEPCRRGLLPMAATIAYTYAGQGSYRKALEWSACAKDFPLVERMQWLYSLENYCEVERLYANYSDNSSLLEKEAIQVFMTEYFMGRGEIAEAWKIASQLPSSPDKERLGSQLNKDVLYIKSEGKRHLLKTYPSLFHPEVASRIQRELTVTEGDFLRIGSDVISDRLDPTSIGAEALYGIRDKKLYLHQIGLSRYRAFEIPFQTEMPNNMDQDLYGILYRFKTNPGAGRFNYGLGTRLEFNEAGKAYLHLEASASISKDSLFSSLQFFRKPAVTGPAYALDIYQTQVNIYEELQFKKRFQAVLFIEGNHYSDEDVLDVQALANVAMDFKLTKRAVLRPYSELAGMLGNTNRPGGFPYWTLDERFYGGLGASYQYRNEKNLWKIDLDAAYFLDTFSDQFQRYRGSILWPVSEYLHFNTHAEFYSLKNFYSNNFSFGLKYLLKDI